MQYVFAPQIADGPVFEDSSKEIQIETVLEYKPDLCICMVKDTVSLLESKGLTVIYLEWKQQATCRNASPCWAKRSANRTSPGTT
jgi:iron complex transport system substrate-binding protein